MDKIVITTGDPNGIGAEVTVKALKNFNREDFKKMNSEQEGLIEEIHWAFRVRRQIGRASCRERA